MLKFVSGIPVFQRLINQNLVTLKSNHFVGYIVMQEIVKRCLLVPRVALTKYHKLVNLDD